MQPKKPTSREFFLSRVDVVEECVRQVTSRLRFSFEDAADFRSEVMLQLLDDDCRILRSFEAKSSLKTYLVKTIANMALSYRRKAWGRWKPSAQALRAGSLVVELEELVYRDLIPLGEAIEALVSRYGSRACRRQLEEAFVDLPRRLPRKALGDAHLLGAVIHDGPERKLEEPARSALSKAVATAIAGSLAALDDEDREILRMRYGDGISIADIARALGIDQRRLYRRLSQRLTAMRRQLENSRRRRG